MGQAGPSIVLFQKGPKFSNSQIHLVLMFPGRRFPQRKAADVASVISLSVVISFNPAHEAVRRELQIL